MWAPHRLPRRISGDKPEQKSPVIVGEGGGEFAAEAPPSVFERAERDGIALHAGELVLKGTLQREIPRAEHLMHRAVVPGDVTDEALHELGTQAEAFEHAVDIEEVPRMLAVERGDEFASVEFGHRRESGP